MKMPGGNDIDTQRTHLRFDQALIALQPLLQPWGLLPVGCQAYAKQANAAGRGRREGCRKTSGTHE